MCLPLTCCVCVLHKLDSHSSLTPDPWHCSPLLSEVPVTIVQGPQDLEVTEGDTATFECELSQTLADVIWEKVRAWP